ncbi:MAG TPA: VOC family protein [Pyrinomonadaceae bacterium]|jgi:catechol 2,3-dioxygenase-like lactoylglutathione lyase family enzyme|nr:VOC family protein [Pyrinomonadaceae bacterium]
MKIIGVNHVQITIPVGAESEAREFYCSFLGLKEIEKPDELKGRGGFWLDVGIVPVHIGVEDLVERPNSKAHVAYTVDDLETWRQKLSKRGITVTDGIQITNFRRFEFRDPFGNRVEFLQKES